MLFFLPFGVDAVVIYLAARDRDLFWIYPLLATAGSLVGAALTYWIGREDRRRRPEAPRSRAAPRAAAMPRPRQRRDRDGRAGAAAAAVSADAVHPDLRRAEREPVAVLRHLRRRAAAAVRQPRRCWRASTAAASCACCSPTRFRSWSSASSSSPSSARSCPASSSGRTAARVGRLRPSVIMEFPWRPGTPVKDVRTAGIQARRVRPG